MFQPVRVIRLGTEEVKKYAILNKKDGGGGGDSEDEEDYDRFGSSFSWSSTPTIPLPVPTTSTPREDRELYPEEEEALANDPEAQEWLDTYTERVPEGTTLKVLLLLLL